MRRLPTDGALKTTGPSAGKQTVRAFNPDFNIHVSRVKDKLDVRVYKGKKLVYRKKIKEGETVKVIFNS